MKGCRWIVTGVLLALSVLVVPGPVSGGPSRWVLWDQYRNCCIQPDGRVVDHGRGDVTTSEGQAYALFFALVDNDPALFARLLRWTRDNLSRGDLSRHLPAWLWGREKDGRWGVIDKNPATDADLWLSYTLMEAGNLWNSGVYTRLGTQVASMIARREIVTLPGAGPFPLGGPKGFHPEKGVWRTHPSYLPPFLLRFMENRFGTAPWSGMPRRFSAMLSSVSKCGFAPDWVQYLRGKGWREDPVTGPLGSYDAIRVYLWDGLTSPRDPDARVVRSRLRGWIRKGYSVPTLYVNTKTCAAYGPPPAGFVAAYLPFAERVRSGVTRRFVSGVLKKWDTKKTAGYYDTNLALFGTGFREGRFSFDGRGRLHVLWMAR